MPTAITITGYKNGRQIHEMLLDAGLNSHINAIWETVARHNVPRVKVHGLYCLTDENAERFLSLYQERVASGNTGKGKPSPTHRKHIVVSERPDKANPMTPTRHEQIIATARAAQLERLREMGISIRVIEMVVR